jgi:hypothetical protein
LWFCKLLALATRVPAVFLWKDVKMEWIGPDLIRLALVASDQPGADIIEQIKSGNLSYPSMAVLAILGIFTLYVAYKIGRFMLKIFCILIGLVAIVAAISWFFLRH